MTQTLKQLDSPNRNDPPIDGLRHMNVTGWSFARIHQVLNELEDKGWFLTGADTVGGNLVLILSLSSCSGEGGK